MYIEKIWHCINKIILKSVQGYKTVKCFGFVLYRVLTFLITEIYGAAIILVYKVNTLMGLCLHVYHPLHSFNVVVTVAKNCIWFRCPNHTVFTLRYLIQILDTASILAKSNFNSILIYLESNIVSLKYWIGYMYHIPFFLNFGIGRLNSSSRYSCMYCILLHILYDNCG